MADINAKIQGDVISSSTCPAGASLADGIIVRLNGKPANIAVTVGAAAGLGSMELSARCHADDTFRVMALDGGIETAKGTYPLRWVLPEVGGVAAKDTAASKSVAFVFDDGIFEIKIRASRVATVSTTIAVAGTALRQRVIGPNDSLNSGVT